MGNFILSCCSTADLTKGHFEERNIHYICFHFSLNGRQYADDLGRSISFPDFYEAMRQGAETKTSQVNENEFEAYFTPFLENGQDIVHVCLSSGISGVYNSAMLAKRTLEEKYPERKIFVLDSLLASSGYGLLMDALADRISSMFMGGIANRQADVMVTNARQAGLLRQARQSLRDVISGLDNDMPLDMVQMDLTDAWDHLGEITGDAAPDELITTLFSQFCLGK